MPLEIKLAKLWHSICSYHNHEYGNSLPGVPDLRVRDDENEDQARRFWSMEHLQMYVWPFRGSQRRRLAGLCVALTCGRGRLAEDPPILEVNIMAIAETRQGRGLIGVARGSAASGVIRLVQQPPARTGHRLWDDPHAFPRPFPNASSAHIFLPPPSRLRRSLPRRCQA